VFPASFVPLVMIGGLVTGIFTATEAACIAVLAAYFVAFVFFKEFKFHKESFRKIFKII
jgi:C4-dicarboxylate transporter DctM subunit